MTGGERDLIGEYVLGTLGDDERRSFEAALARDPELAASVERFAARVRPLDETVSPNRSRRVFGRASKPG